MRIGAHALSLWIGDHYFHTGQNLNTKTKTKLLQENNKCQDYEHSFIISCQDSPFQIPISINCEDFLVLQEWLYKNKTRHVKIRLHCQSSHEKRCLSYDLRKNYALICELIWGLRAHYIRMRSTDALSKLKHSQLPIITTLSAIAVLLSPWRESAKINRAPQTPRARCARFSLPELVRYFR